MSLRNIITLGFEKFLCVCAAKCVSHALWGVKFAVFEQGSSPPSEGTEGDVGYCEQFEAGKQEGKQVILNFGPGPAIKARIKTKQNDLYNSTENVLCSDYFLPMGVTYYC